MVRQMLTTGATSYLMMLSSENCGLCFQRIDELKPWTPDTDESRISVPHVDTVSAETPKPLSEEEGNARKRRYKDDADTNNFRNVAFISKSDVLR